MTEALKNYFIMIILFGFIYLISLLYLCVYYGEHYITPSIWSMGSIFLPIVNTIVFICLLIKNRKDIKMKNFFSIKNFFNELKK